MSYLLARDHPEGGEKASYFLNNGFSVAHQHAIAEALLLHVRENPIQNTRTNPFGTTYAVDGPIIAPNQRQLLIRSVWVVESGRPNPRFVTAYPLRRMTP